MTEHRDRRLQAAVVLAALVIITALTVVVISAWKTSSGSRDIPQAVKRTVVTHHAKAPPAYLEITAVHGPSKVIVNSAGVNGKVLFSGTLERGDMQAFNGRRFWLNVGAPENLVIRVGGRRVHVAGFRPWVLTVTPTGWQGHAA